MHQERIVRRPLARRRHDVAATAAPVAPVLRGGGDLDGVDDVLRAIDELLGGRAD